LKLGPARPAQSQAAEPQDTLEMRKQHLNAFSVMARSLECFSLGQRASNITSLLVDAAWHPAESRLWTAMRLQWAAPAVTLAGCIEACIAVIAQLAGVGQRAAGWAHVHVPLLVELKIIPTEGPVLPLRLVDHREARANLLAVDEPVEVCPRPVGGIGREPL